jgi:hypothetical protein
VCCFALYTVLGLYILRVSGGGYSPKVPCRRAGVGLRVHGNVEQSGARDVSGR